VTAETRFCPDCGNRLSATEPAEGAAPEDTTTESAPPASPSRWERPLGVARARTGATFDSFTAHTRARFGLYRLRRELGRIERTRREHFRAFGEAVYRGDEPRANDARAALRELDDAAAARERDAAALVAEAEERIRAARLSGRPTALERPAEDPGSQQET
jgi:hypothetical protein